MPSKTFADISEQLLDIHIILHSNENQNTEYQIATIIALDAIQMKTI